MLFYCTLACLKNISIGLSSLTLTRLILASAPRWGLPPLWFRGDRLPLLGGDLSLLAGDLSLLAGDLSLLAGDRSRGLTGDLDEGGKRIGFNETIRIWMYCWLS